MGPIRYSQLLGVCLVGVVTLLSGRPLHADEHTIAFLNTEAVPYKWKEDGKFIGPVLDIVREAKHRTGIDFKMTPMSAKRLLYMVEKGAILGGIGVTYASTREEWANFVDVPIGWLETHAFVRKDSKIDVKSIEDLYTLRVAVISGFSYYSKAYQDALASGKIVPQEIRNYESLLKFLLLDRADVIISPTAPLHAHISKTGATDKVKRLPFPIHERIPLFLMISKKASESVAGAVAAQKLEAALVSMQKEKAIAAIYKKHGFGFFAPE